MSVEKYDDKHIIWTCDSCKGVVITPNDKYPIMLKGCKDVKFNVGLPPWKNVYNGKHICYWCS